jgi:hypothetical protein
VIPGLEGVREPSGVSSRLVRTNRAARLFFVIVARLRARRLKLTCRLLSVKSFQHGFGCLILRKASHYKADTAIFPTGWASARSH